MQKSLAYEMSVQINGKIAPRAPSEEGLCAASDLDRESNLAQLLIPQSDVSPDSSPLRLYSILMKRNLFYPMTVTSRTICDSVRC